jgi:hypothetical protein
MAYWSSARSDMHRFLTLILRMLQYSNLLLIGERPQPETGSYDAPYLCKPFGFENDE